MSETDAQLGGAELVAELASRFAAGDRDGRGR